jgi:hypothetical protein
MTARVKRCAWKPRFIQISLSIIAAASIATIGTNVGSKPSAIGESHQQWNFQYVRSHLSCPRNGSVEAGAGDVCLVPRGRSPIPRQWELRGEGPLREVSCSGPNQVIRACSQ